MRICLRINPGNIGSEAKIREVVAAARHNDISMRIGVNAGSLEKDIQKKYGEPTGQALLESAMRHIDILDRLDFHEFESFSESIQCVFNHGCLPPTFTAN